MDYQIPKKKPDISKTDFSKFNNFFLKIKSAAVNTCSYNDTDLSKPATTTFIFQSKYNGIVFANEVT